jgi:cyclase
MVRYRVIPCLLLQNQGLVKTIKFKDPTYLGDPINIVRIFNDKEVDELVFLDITATIEQRKPPIQHISQIAQECFMPLGYGGGIRNLCDVKEILGLGVEKIIINSYAVEHSAFIGKAADMVGSQSIVVSIDVKKNFMGKYQVHTHGGRNNTHLDPVNHAVNMEAAGAGELLLNSINCDGTMQGYDIDLIKKVSDAVNIPVVACGGAAGIIDLVKAVKMGKAAAVAAGSIFVFHGKHRAVLISYPSRKDIQQAFEAVSL